MNDADRREAEELQRVRLANAQDRYEHDRTDENKKACRNALHEFANIVMRWKQPSRV
jgi:hypothetical protein